MQGLAWEYLYVDNDQQPTLPASLTIINILQLLWSTASGNDFRALSKLVLKLHTV